MKDLLKAGRAHYRSYNRCVMQIRRLIHKAQSKELRDGPFILYPKYEPVTDVWLIEVHCVDAVYTFFANLEAISTIAEKGRIITERDLLDNQVTLDLPF